MKIISKPASKEYLDNYDRIFSQSNDRDSSDETDSSAELNGIELNTTSSDFE